MVRKRVLLMSVYKRGSSWTAQVYVAQKRVKTKSGFKRKADAEKFIIETKALYLTDPTAAKANKSHLVEELLKEYELKHLPTIGVGTRTRYEIDIRLRIRPYFSRFKTDSLSPKLIDQFRTDLIRANKLSYKSINEYMIEKHHAVRYMGQSKEAIAEEHIANRKFVDV